MYFGASQIKISFGNTHVNKSNFLLSETLLIGKERKSL